MLKELLTTSRVVTFRNGFKAMVYNGVVECRPSANLIVNPKLTVYIPSDEYNYDLFHRDDSSYDIMRIEALNSLFEFNKPVEMVTVGRTLWIRNEPKTILRSEICKRFACESFIIVDDETLETVD